MKPSPLPAFSSSLGRSVLPLSFKKKERKNFCLQKPDLSRLSIFFLETLDGIYFYSSPTLFSPSWVSISSRHERIVERYTYFLIFAQIRNKHLRYGLYFRCQGSLLEIKCTLYSHPEIPLFINIYLKGELMVSQILFMGNNFNFFFPWDKVKTEYLKIHLIFLDNHSWIFPLQFSPLLSI